MVHESVSIVVINRNNGRFLEQALHSATTQTVRCEVILVDGCSTDNSMTIAEKFPITTLLEPVRGVGRARNLGISGARSTWIVPLDSDDWLEPNFVERSLAAATNSQAGIVAGGLWFEYAERPREVMLPKQPVSIGHLLKENCIFNTSMFRRRAWHEVGGYTPLSDYEDWDLWIRLMAAGWHCEVIESPLYHYRVHDAMHTATLPSGGSEALCRYMRLRHADLIALHGSW